MGLWSLARMSNVLDHQKQQRTDRLKANPAPLKRAAKGTVAVRSNKVAPATGEFVIPASGAIHCNASGGGYVISQGDAFVCASRDQLQALRDWATVQLKAVK